ncbi:hypothetical protein N9N13_06990 [Opitutales bacterium]|nr:hypothetical protein [Opitutales bacterium]
MKIFPYFSICTLLFLFLNSCSEEKLDAPENAGEPSTQSEKKPKQAVKVSSLDFPNVYIEELDQSQEFYKEQHETSFSFVSKKNWFSYTSGKDGILTKVLLFGKPNFKPSDHYGDSMHGFLREGNPDSGPKLGEWDLSRDDIVNQIAAQGLGSREAGWITIRMRGEIPQIAGKTYFLVCEKITGEKPWFGAFAFGEGNPYLPGKFWLHPDHDLVFRTYVGKTPEQVAKEQKNEEVSKQLGLTNTPPPQNPSDLPTPLPISQSPSKNLVIQNFEPKDEPKIESKEIPIVPPTSIEKSVEPSGEQVEELNLIQIPNGNIEDQNNSSEKKSLFNRLFKKK